jgi:hypothetical protein
LPGSSRNLFRQKPSLRRCDEPAGAHPAELRAQREKITESIGDISVNEGANCHFQDGSGWGVFDRDIYRNHHAAGFLTNPVIGVPVANDLMEFLIDEIQGLTPVVKFGPPQFSKIGGDLRWPWVPSGDILHARDYAWTIRGKDDSVRPNIERRYKTLHQAKGIEVNRGTVFVTSKFSRELSPSKLFALRTGRYSG